MAGPDVFLSYSRGESSPYASALQQSLTACGISTFLDTSQIRPGDEFLSRMIGELLGARVVVIFAGEQYFERPACTLEYEAAKAPHELLQASDPDGVCDEFGAVGHIVIGIVPGTRPDFLNRTLPLAIARHSWPPADHTEALVDTIKARLRKHRRSIEARLGALQAMRVKERAEIIQGHTDDLNAIPTCFPPGGIPKSLDSEFVGRAGKLIELRNALSPARNLVGTAVVLSGRAGSGKSTLASEYVHRLGARAHPGGIFWIDVTRALLETQHYEIARTLLERTAARSNVPLPIPSLPELQAAGRSARDLLRDAVAARPPDESMLFVFDNFPEGSAGATPPALSDYCPVLDQVAVLVTCRQRTVFAGDQSLFVPELSPSAAVVMLTRRVSRPDVLTPAEWISIGSWVGFLPVALQLLNGAVADGDDSEGDEEPPEGAPAITAPGHLLQVASSQSSLFDARFEGLASSVPANALQHIVDAFSVSFDLLGPATQRAATLIAQFGPAAIPKAATDALAEGAVSVRSLDLLRRRSFLRDRSHGVVTTEGSMHRLLAEFVRLRAEGSEPVSQVCTALQKVFMNNLPGNSQHWPLLNLCCEHAQAIFERQEARPEGAGARAAVRIATMYAPVLSTLGRRNEELSWLRRIVPFSTNVYGPSHPFTTLSASSLASELESQGDTDQAKKIAAAALDAARERSGTSLVTRVVAHQARSLGASLDYDFETNPPTGGAGKVTDLFHAAMTAETDQRVSRDLYEKTLALASQVLGDASPMRVNMMLAYASTLLRWGDLERSGTLIREGLERLLARFGRNRVEVTRAMSLYADWLGATGELEQARELSRTVLRIRRRALKTENPDTMQAVCDLAFVAGRLRRYREANRLYAVLLKTATKVLGPGHPQTLHYAGLALGPLRGGGRAADALQLARSSYESACRELAADHEQRIDTEHEYTFELAQTGHLEEARTLIEDVRRRVIATFGEMSSRSVDATWELGRVLWRLRDPRWEELTARACELCDQVHGPEDRKSRQLRKLAAARTRLPV